MTDSDLQADSPSERPIAEQPVGETSVGTSHTVSEEQKRKARRTAFIVLGIVLGLTLLTLLGRVLGW